jgi:hypothetical protein
MSYRRAAAASDGGKFKDEIVGVPVKGKKGDTLVCVLLTLDWCGAGCLLVCLFAVCLFACAFVFSLVLPGARAGRSYKGTHARSDTA